jgi:hypothetical protein
MKPIAAIIVLVAVAGPGAPPVGATSDILMYPKQGQSQAQQDKDRYDCHTWAKGQTGYDPTAPPPQVAQAPPPSGSQHSAVRGAGRGAALGAIGGAIAGDAGKGAAIGAGVGAAGGAIRRRSDEQQQAQAQAQAQAGQSAATQQGADAYKRAMGVCLEGRNYAVK